jgi:L-threonylcarbamoyladenylate synthase
MTHYGISQDVELAVEILQNGGVIGLPTETVYGLAALALDENAVGRVFDIKGRPRNHPLIVHLGPSVDYREWGNFNEQALSLAKSFWPGPLTLLVPRTTLVPDWVTGGRDSVAIRVPSHPVAQDLLTQVKSGVVAPSANKFGKVSPTSPQHVLDDLGTDVDVILDGGVCAVGLESTIIECTDVFQILRPGYITTDVVSSCVGTVPEGSSGASRAPGMLTSHYAPSARVVIVDSLQQADESVREWSKTKKVRILHFADVSTYAEHLYDELRKADQENYDIVVAVRAPESGLGIAINDRLSKASAGR